MISISFHMKNPSRTPTPVATPLPPVKRMYGDQLCPATAASPAMALHAKAEVEHASSGNEVRAAFP